MNWSGNILAMLILFVAPATSARAESLGEQAEADSGSCHCFVGKPYPRCHDFWVVEIGPGIAVASTADWMETGTTMVATDFGFMKNLNSRSGVGMTLFGASDKHGMRAGLRLRYRRWLSPKTALDLSPGLLVVGGQSPQNMDVNYPSLIATASMTYASRISVFVGVECLTTNDWYNNMLNLPGRGKNTETILWTGLSGGSELGVTGLVAILGLAVVMAATY